MMLPALRRLSLSLVPLAVLCIAIPSSAQQKEFEVVSIRQNIDQQRGGPINLSPGPDGFRVQRQPLMNVLMTAYTPKEGGLFLNRIDGMPDWLRNERYDIVARISDTDRTAWNDPKNQPAMLQQMLQSMLADRFKLTVHRETKEKPVYELLVTRGSSKLQETKPDEPGPAGATLPGGGVMGPGADGATHMHNFSMGLLAALLTSKSDRPVLDKTGLTGRYTFDIREPQQMAAPSAVSTGESEEERRPAISDALKSIGLELRPAKEPIEFLIIDHIERPTPN